MAIDKIKKSGSHVIGTFSSVKLGDTVWHDSPVEREFLYFLEYYLWVLWYKLQPMTISMTLADGKAHEYTPDVLVKYTEGLPAIVECEFAAFANEESCLQQIYIGSRWAAENNHAFLLVTDQDLRRGHRLKNLKILYRYRQLPVPFEILSACLAYLNENPDGVNLQVLLRHLKGDPSRLKPYIWSMVFQHLLDTDLDQPMNRDEALIRIATKEVRWPDGKNLYSPGNQIHA